MKTISKSAARRLEVQRAEAELQGMEQTVAHIDAILTKNGERDSDSNYIYAFGEYTQDIKDLLWAAIVRTADYYGKNFDVEAADQFVNSFVDQIASDAKVAVGAEKLLIGPHEPSVPGEVKRTMEAVKLAKEKLKASLGHPNWLRGIGITGTKDNYCIKVLVSVASDNIKDSIPDKVDGVPVIVEAVGDIIAL